MGAEVDERRAVGQPRVDVDGDPGAQPYREVHPGAGQPGQPLGAGDVAVPDVEEPGVTDRRGGGRDLLEQRLLAGVLRARGRAVGVAERGLRPGVDVDQKADVRERRRVGARPEALPVRRRVGQPQEGPVEAGDPERSRGQRLRVVWVEELRAQHRQDRLAHRGDHHPRHAAPRPGERRPAGRGGAAGERDVRDRCEQRRQHVVPPGARHPRPQDQRPHDDPPGQRQRRLLPAHGVVGHGVVAAGRCRRLELGERLGDQPVERAGAEPPVEFGLCRSQRYVVRRPARQGQIPVVVGPERPGQHRPVDDHLVAVAGRERALGQRE
ncbi:hypothetical protein, partial [Frankia sp. Cj3]|uniref:hypothetical protein n=1 Tax=Frankia sp. Cj3 TaxID=2880976 RepID=UPI001EF5BB80